MKSVTLCIVLTISLSVISPTFAKLSPWTPNLPSSTDSFNGTVQQLADLTGEHILIYAHPATSIQLPTLKKQTKAQFYSAAVVVPVAETQVKQLLSHYPNYVGLFPTLKSAKVLETQGHIQQVKYQVHIPTPIPILNFKENVVMQHQMGTHSIDTLIIDAPIPYGVGKIEWFALGPHKTLITVTQWGDLNQPKGFLFTKILNALPEAKLGIPAGTNAFLLEALQQRFKAKTSISLNSDQRPDVKLTTQQKLKVAALSQQSAQPVTFILPNARVKMESKAENMRFSTSFHYFNSAPSRVQPWLSAEASQQLFPRQIKKVERHQINSQQFDVNYTVAVGLGVIQIPFDFKMRYQQPTPFQNQFDAIGGDLKFVKAGMQLQSYGQGSLFQMTSAIKIHDQAPFLLRAMRSLPYHDMIPAVGANTVYALKIQQRLK